MAEVPQQKIAALEKKVGAGGKSPLFAQLAGLYVQQGKATEALHLCDEGLAVFPHYTTGHLIKGKALLALKMNAEARREFEIVAGFLPANETVAFILSNIQPGEDETLVATSPQPSIPETPARETPLSEVVSETTPTVEPEAQFSEQEPSPTPPSSVFEAVGQTPEIMEDPFGFGGGRTETTPAEPATEEPAVNPFDGFPTQAEPETTTPVSESPSANIFDFPFQSQEPPAAISNEESFEDFSARMRSDLSGTENTMTLEDYLSASSMDGGSAPQEPRPSSSETIENLAEKLQSAKKITPVINLSTKATIPASELDTPAGTGFVTPTLAEIYAKQGWYDDAIKAYHTLIVTKPAEKERFEKRIAELEELKKQQS